MRAACGFITRRQFFDGNIIFEKKEGGEKRKFSFSVQIYRHRFKNFVTATSSYRVT